MSGRRPTTRITGGKRTREVEDNSRNTRRRFTSIQGDDILRLEAVMDAKRAYESSVHMDRSGLHKLNDEVLQAAMENRVSYARRLAIFDKSPWKDNDMVSHSIMHQVLRLLGMIQQIGRPDHLELEFAVHHQLIRRETNSLTWTSRIRVGRSNGVLSTEPLDLNNVRYAPIFAISPRDYKTLIALRLKAAGAGGSSDFPVVAYHCHPAYSRVGENMKFYPHPVDFDRFLKQNESVLEGFDQVWGSGDLYYDNGVARYTQERTDSAYRTQENLNALIEEHNRIRNEVMEAGVKHKPKRTLADVYPKRLVALKDLQDRVRMYSVPLQVTKSTAFDTRDDFSKWSRNALRFMFELEEFQPFPEPVQRRGVKIRTHWMILCQGSSGLIDKVIRACPRQCLEYVWLGLRDESLMKIIRDITTQFPDMKDKFSFAFLGAADSGELGVSYKDMPCVQSSSTLVGCTAAFLDALVFLEAIGDCALKRRTALVTAVRLQLIRPDGQDSRARDTSSIALGNGGTDYGNGFGASSETTTTSSRPVVCRSGTTLPAQGFATGTTTTPTVVDRVEGFTFGNEIHAVRPGATGNSTVTVDAHRPEDLPDEVLVDMMVQHEGSVSTTGAPLRPVVVVPHNVSDASGNAQVEEEEHVQVNVVGDAPRIVVVDARGEGAVDFRNATHIDGRGGDDFIPPNERDNAIALPVVDGHLETRASVPARFNEKREPLAQLPRYHGPRGPTAWAAPPVVNIQGVRLINFTQYYSQIHHTVTEQVYTAPPVIDGLDDWITSPILGNIPWGGYDNTYGDAGKGIRAFKFEVVMVVVRRDDGAIDMTGLRLDGAYNHDVKTDNVIDIRRELLRHEITGDIAVDADGRPVRRVDPETNSYLNVFTDIGGVHADDGTGARTGFKTYIDSEQPRALGPSVAFQEEKGQPAIRINLPKENLAEMDMPQYSVKMVGATEGVVVANTIEIGGGLTTSARDAIHETFKIPTSITPTKHFIRGEDKDLPVKATGNLVTEAMGIVGTAVSGVLRIDGSSRTRQPAPIQVGGQIIPQEVRNINLGYQGSTGSSVFRHGTVKLRVVGWVLPEASFVWTNESTDEFDFGKVYVQGATPGGDPTMKEVFVHGDYNFCGRLYAEQEVNAAPVMRVEVLRSLNRYDAPFTVMFDEYVILGPMDRSVLWKHSGIVKKITQERQKVVHTVPVLDEEGAPTGATTTVEYEGLTNRLLVSYFPVPAYDKGPDINGGFFSCEWFHAAAVQGAVFWTRDRFSGNGDLDDESVAAMEGLMNE